MITDKKVFADEAFLFLKEYASKHTEFLMEDVRIYARSLSFADASDPSWWGNVATAGRKAGLIEATGQRRIKNRIEGVTSGTTYGMVWRSKVFTA